MARETAVTAEPVSGTPERILQAAERLFSERGIDGVSLREITTAAGVNSASAHYHFGSKQAVIEKLFALRAKPIADRRAELLSRVGHDKQGRPILEDVLRAFLKPALDVLSTPEGAAFTLLRARMALERDEVRLTVMKAFDHTSEMTVEALSRALPELDKTELYWRFHFLLGSMVYTMAQPGRIESISRGEVKTSDASAALGRLVAFAAAGFRAP